MCSSQTGIIKTGGNKLQNLSDFLAEINRKSGFPSSLGSSGGYINFRNSGIRGGVKEFTLSLESLMQGLEDIKNNLEYFENLKTYDESKWRDAGSRFFTDLALNSIITVQTKPCFTTFSKVINWANEFNNYNDNNIELNEISVNKAINALKTLSLSYTPKVKAISRPIKAELVADNVIGDFIFKVFEYLIKHKIENLLTDKLRETTPGSINLEHSGSRLTSIFKRSNTPKEANDLISGEKLRFFDNPYYFDNAYYYLSKEWTLDKDSRLDLRTFQSIFNAVYSDYKVVIDGANFSLIENRVTKEMLLAKSFVLFAGISGTGKTRFIREQAEQSGSLDKTYQLVPVRPDWHEPSDLLGYVSRLNGKPEYVATYVLKFIVKAWQAIVKAGFDFDGKKITGNKNSLASVAPYWLCLDEMNLAPVEQYFADYLSVIETRKWAHTGDDVEYTCDALLSKDTINDVADNLRSALELNGTENDALWGHFTEFGISLPFNLIVAGTVNMDEITHGFSRKVLDRALSFDFGEFFPNNFDTFFVSTTQNFTLNYPIWSDGRDLDALATTFDSDGSKSVAFLKAVNTALDNTSFKLAYRALNELLLAVICTQPKNEQALMAVWDDFVMCKVLPRIEGDYDKLAVNGGAGSNNGGEQRTVLSELKKLLAENMALIWDGEQRPDLYREKITPDASGSSTILIACRSNKKLGWMEQRLSSASFTSFWP